MNRDVPATHAEAVGGTLPFWIGIVCLGVAAASAFGLLVEPTSGPGGFPVENGPIELLQVLLLLGSIAALVFTLVRSASSEIAAFSLILAYVLFHATVREMPRCNSAFYEGGACFPDEWKNWARLAATVLALLAFRLKRISWRKTDWTRDRSWLLPGAAAVAVLAAAQFASTLILVRLEEILELAGYVIVLVMCLNVLARDMARGAAERGG